LGSGESDAPQARRGCRQIISWAREHHHDGVCFVKPISIFGGLLIIVGIAALVLGEVSLTKRETVLQIGDAKVEAQTKDSIPLPPIDGVAANVAGLVLVVVGYRKR